MEQAWMRGRPLVAAFAFVAVACGVEEQAQGIPPLELCLPADVPAAIEEAIDRAVEAIETQAGVDAFEVVPGGPCGGAWGTVDVFVRDDSPHGDMWCEKRGADNVKRCKVWLPRQLATEGYCEDVMALHELGHIVIGGEHVDGTAMAEVCAPGGRPYFSWRQVDEMRRHFLRGEQVVWTRAQR